MERGWVTFPVLNKHFSVWQKPQLFSHPTEPLLVAILSIRETTKQKTRNIFSKKGSSEGSEVSGAGKTWGEQTRICMPIDGFNIH